ncbi:hypothetical protein BJX76DRAFT_332238 [Aspergillus varians]
MYLGRLLKRALRRICFPCISRQPNEDEIGPNFIHLASPELGEEVLQPAMSQVEEIFKLKRQLGPFFYITEEDLIPIPEDLEGEMRKSRDRINQQAEMVIYCLEDQVNRARELKHRALGHLSFTMENGLEYVVKYRKKPMSLTSFVDATAWYEDSATAVGLVLAGMETNDRKDPKLDCVLSMASTLCLKKNKSAIMYGVVALENGGLEILRMDSAGKLMEWRPPCAQASSPRTHHDKIEFYALSRFIVQDALGNRKPLKSKAVQATKVVYVQDRLDEKFMQY